MRVLCMTGGTHGDLNPVLGLGRTLRKRGHEVRVVAPHEFAEDTARAGLAFAPMLGGFSLDAVANDARIYHPRHAQREVFRLAFAAAPALVETTDREINAFAPDIVVRHHFLFGPRWACARAGVPCATLAMSPAVWFSLQDPVAAVQHRAGATARNLARWTQRALRPIAEPVYNARMNRVRESLGFAKEQDAFVRDLHGVGTQDDHAQTHPPQAIASRTGGTGPILGLWSPATRPAMPDDPVGSRVCGFSWYDGQNEAAADHTLPAQLEDFLDAGEPPIVVALGSLLWRRGGAFYQLAHRAATRARCRVVLLTGGSEDPTRPRPIPRDDRAAIAVPWASFSALLPRVAGVVHHGGMGSFGQATRAGVPQIVVPHVNDQFHNAARAITLGLARATSRTRLSERWLAAAMDAALNDQHWRDRTHAIGLRVRAERGTDDAADAIEATIRRA